ncbi:MAG: SPOR domain-containing protein, partial [Rhodospirillales bacterium]
ASEWKRLSTANSDLLGGLDLNVVRADLGAKGVFYRLRAGPLGTSADATALCDALKARKVGCMVIRP